MLEVGAGSGYQAAVLAELVAKVYTIEIVEALGRRAKQLLNDLGYRNVELRIGNGYNGWPEAGLSIRSSSPRRRRKSRRR